MQETNSLLVYANKEKSKQLCFCLLDDILGREGISHDIWFFFINVRSGGP